MKQYRAKVNFKNVSQKVIYSDWGKLEVARQIKYGLALPIHKLGWKVTIEERERP